MAKTQKSGEFSVTEENARPGGAGTPEVPPAGNPGERSIPAAPSPVSNPTHGTAPSPAPAGSGTAPGAIPPRPSTPPTSATPIVPQAASAATSDRTSVAPAKADAPDPATAAGLEASTETKAGSSAVSGAGMAGAATLVSATAARLGRWVRRQSLPRIGAAAVVLVVVGLLVWLLASTLGASKPSEAAGAPAAAGASTAPASRGPLPLESVSPLDFQLGDCFKDFDPDAPQSTVVACDTGHSAQLVAVAQYAAPDAYPGRDKLKEKARAACQASPLAEKSGDYDLSYKLAYPSSSSWEKGDRRVDCYAVANTGNVIKESLLP